MTTIEQVVPGLVILALVAVWVARRKPRNDSPLPARRQGGGSRWFILLGWTLPLV
jgi:hypothetical protein